MADPMSTFWSHNPDNYWYDMDTHPTVQCVKTLSAYNKGDKAEFLKGVSWLIENQDKNGAWPMPFNYKIAGFKAKAPWLCCMTQGMGLSVLTRALESIKFEAQPRRLGIAHYNAIEPFETRIENGGLVLYTGKNNFYKWYQGVPSKKGYHILNEYLFALIGLVEATGGLNTTDKVTLEENLHQFDLNLPYFKWSRYDNSYHFFASTMYHRVMIQQLEWLAEKIDSTICKDHAEKWAKWEELYSKDCKAKYIMFRVRNIYDAILGKVVENNNTREI